jgi:hypothetical protein
MVGPLALTRQSSTRDDPPVERGEKAADEESVSSSWLLEAGRRMGSYNQ